MRKLDDDRAKWLARQQALLQSESIREAGFARHQFGRRRKPRRPRRVRTTVITMPERILAETAPDRGKLLKVLQSMINCLERTTSKVKLDFSRTQRLFPGGMLILMAYLELLLEDFPHRIQARCAPNSLSAQLMRHFGIADRLGISQKISQPTHKSVVRWRYLTGKVADGTSINELIEGYKKLTAAEIPDGLYEALTEALTNVRQHAYPPNGHVPDELQRWWLFSCYEEPEGDAPGSLYVGVYDIGVGISASMRTRMNRSEKLLDTAGNLLDWTGIEGTSLLDRVLLVAAVEKTRSRTGQDFRGNGLPEMRDFVLRTKSGRLSIVTGRAQYACMASKTSGQATASEPVLGTLILWSIPLHPKEKLP